MQIIQAGPSSQTLRQKALQDSFDQVLGGIKALDAEKRTKRQEALQLQKRTEELRSQGYDVNEDMVKKSLEPEQSGLAKFFAQTPIGQSFGMEVQERPDLYGKRTAEYEAKQKQAAEDRKIEKEFKQSQINKNNRPEIPRAGVAINPDGTPMTWEQKKQREIQLTNEAKIAEEERKRADPRFRLEKLGGEAQGKVGAIASGLQAIDQMGKAFDAGQTMDYIDANTPFVGALMSDTDVTAAERTMSEVVGRLQSGGAIGVVEAKTFQDMGPRRGDSKEEKLKKLNAQRDFLSNKLAGFQLKPEELPGLGFKTTFDGKVMAPNSGIGNKAAANDIKKQLSGMSREEKIKLLQGGSPR